jgi:hypothetical protein
MVVGLLKRGDEILGIGVSRKRYLGGAAARRRRGTIARVPMNRFELEAPMLRQGGKTSGRFIVP